MEPEEPWLAGLVILLFVSARAGSYFFHRRGAGFEYLPFGTKGLRLRRPHAGIDTKKKNLCSMIHVPFLGLGAT